RAGARVALRMDRTNRSVEQVRILDGPRNVRPPPAAGLPRPPSAAEVLRALPPVTRGVPYVYEESRDVTEVVSESIEDTTAPLRFFPLAGPARLRHCRWKCTVSWVETIESAYPWPLRVRRPRVEVIYLDRDQLIGPR